MIRVLRWFGLCLLVLAGLLVVLLGVARWHDGPIGPFPGGEFRSGELVSDPGDWSFAAALPTLELQLVKPPRSRTTWMIVDAGNLYVPSGYPNSVFKQWPKQVLSDGRVVLRIAGERYERQALRVTDPQLRAKLAAISAKKYGITPPPAAGAPDAENIWFFRMDPR